MMATVYAVSDMASFANSIVHKDGPGLVMGIVGGQITATGMLSESILNVAKAVPIAGTAANLVSLVLDVAQTYRAYTACSDRVK